MTTLREAAQQALEMLERLHGGCTDSDDGTVEAITVWCPEIIDALRAALAEPVQEPVAYRFQSPATEEWLLGLEPPVGNRWEVEPLYTAPPQRKPLTDESIVAMWHQPVLALSALELARAIERAHKIF